MFQKDSINFKLVFIILLMVLFFVSLLTSFQIYSSFDLQKKIEQRGFDSIEKVLIQNHKNSILEFEKNIQSNIVTISKVLSYDLYNLDKKAVTLKLQNYLTSNDICKITVINQIDQKIFSNKIDEKTDLSKCHQFEQLIHYNNENIGKVIVYYSLANIKKRFEENKYLFKSNINNIKRDVHSLMLNSIYTQIFVSIFILIILIYFIIKHINRSIIEPLNKLLDYMQDINENSLDNIKPLYFNDKDDEIGKLYNYFYLHITSLLQKLNYKANYDVLTRLYSRQKLINDLQNIEEFNLCLLDINKFKEFNNFLGIKAGDDIIHKVATFLLDFFDQFKYQVYRFNGDEFAILDLSHKDIKKFEYDIQVFLEHTVKNEFMVNNEMVRVSLCAGIANSENSNPLVAATTALKYSKQEKLDLVIYDNTLPIIEDFKKNFHTTKIIRKAIDKNLILPYFQPIQDIAKGKVLKYEALIRIKDTKGKIYYPDSFLDIAHKSGLYRELSLKMIKKSIKIFKNKDLTLAINLSTKDIGDKKLLNFLEKLKKESFGLQNIVFEITEQAGIENFDEIAIFINDVKKYGAKIAIDDFGSGYSNFENIIHLGIDFLKIDGSLIKNIKNDKSSQIIVETIVDFAKKLDIQTIAEYVSDEEIYHIVKDLGIDFAQGYYIGKPSQKLL